MIQNDTELLNNLMGQSTQYVDMFPYKDFLSK